MEKYMNFINNANFYMDWLISLIEQNNGYLDTSLNYREKIELLDESAQKKLDNLPILVDLVRSYCQRNYVRPISATKTNKEFLIKYKDANYVIGTFERSESSKFPHVVIYSKIAHYSADTPKDIICFEDVINDRPTDYAKYINAKKQVLEECLESLIAVNFPDYIIEDTVMKTLRKPRTNINATGGNSITVK